jgi:hypothetical protein
MVSKWKHLKINGLRLLDAILPPANNLNDPARPEPFFL